MKKEQKIDILAKTLHEFYREDRGDKIHHFFREKIDELRQEYPDVEWMKFFTANIDLIKSAEKKLRLNKKVKKLK